jgi:hypothetical protein
MIGKIDQATFNSGFASLIFSDDGIAQQAGKIFLRFNSTGFETGD